MQCCGDNDSQVTEKVKDICALAVLNIVLPTVDVYSDLYLVIKLWSNGHPRWASGLLAPFLLNYILTWITWYKLETKARLSWIPAFFSCYHQFCAAKIVRQLWNDPRSKSKEQRRFEREVSEMEACTEAVPTVLYMTYLMVQGLLNEGDPERLLPGSLGALLIGQNYCWEDEELTKAECATWYISPDFYFFFISYSASILSASMGIAKCLKVGPCRILAESGLFTSRFILLFFSISCTLTGKGLALGYALGDPILEGMGLWIALATMFLPGFLLAMFNICHYQLAFRDVLNHPSLFLLPTVTNYTFAANRKGEKEVVFSRLWSYVNLLCSLLGNIVYILLVYLLVEGKAVLHSVTASPWLQAWRYYSVYTIAVPILGLVLTFLFLTLDSCLSISLSPHLQYAVLKPEDPMVEYVVDSSQGSKKVVLSESVKNEFTVTAYKVEG